MESQTGVHATEILRRSLHRVGIGFAVLAFVGGWWREQPGASGTRAVVSVAASICPDASGKRTSLTVADGAHVLDKAVFRRMLDTLSSGSRHCRRDRVT